MCSTRSQTAASNSQPNLDAFDLERWHHALAQVFAAADDADEGDEAAAKIRFLVNEGLSYYDVEPNGKN